MRPEAPRPIRAATPPACDEPPSRKALQEHAREQERLEQRMPVDQAQVVHQFDLCRRVAQRPEMVADVRARKGHKKQFRCTVRRPQVKAHSPLLAQVRCAEAACGERQHVAGGDRCFAVDPDCGHPIGCAVNVRFLWPPFHHLDPLARPHPHLGRARSTPAMPSASAVRKRAREGHPSGATREQKLLAGHGGDN